MQEGLRECSSHDGVHFEERSLLVLLRAILVKAKCIFQNTWEDATLSSRETPGGGINGGSPMTLAVTVQMAPADRADSLFWKVPQAAAAEGAGMCSHICSLTLHPASALPSAPATSSIPNFPACRALPALALLWSHLTPQEWAESSSLRWNLRHFVDKSQF